MISPQTLKYCGEDISLIENYAEALASPDKWDCHHRREITENKTRAQLIAEGLYYNRPASELIFLSHEQHKALHGVHSGWRHTEEAKAKIGAAAAKRTGMKSARIRKDVWKHKDEVLRLLALGLSDRKIAKRYDCSRTVIYNIGLAAG